MSDGLYLLIAATVAIATIIVAAQAFGALARFVGQPAVVGEMVAGVLLGPTALGYLLPEFNAWAFSADTKPVLYVFSMLGLGIYMFLIGVAHESEADPRARRLPYWLGGLGVLVPITMGAATTYYLAMDLKPDDVEGYVFVLFIGGALAVTAFPMLARVLQERDMMSTRFGSIAVKAAAVDDALAWCVLAVVGAVAVTGSPSSALLRTVAPAAVFVVVLFLTLPLIFRKAMERAVSAGEISDRLLASLLVLILVASAVSDFIGIYSVFGGFIAGLALPRVAGFYALLSGQVLRVVRCLFLPVFFAHAGLNTDLWMLFHSYGLTVFAGLMLTAFVSKSVSAAAVLRVAGWEKGEVFAMAGLMNARGLMILIYMSIGLSLGIVETELYSIMVLIAIVTTAMAMPMYRVHFNDEREEAARIAWRRAGTAASVASELEKAGAPTAEPAGR